MKFTDYILIEANKKEKSLIEEDDNFILGAELEFCLLYIDNTNDIVKFIKSKTNTEFKHTEDSSIRTENENDGAIEIKTLPKTWKEFQEDVQGFLGIIQKYGYTNNSCGFHVTINYKDNKLPDDFGDKLSSSMQDPKAHRYFPSRKDNQYAQSRTSIDNDYYSKYYSFRIRQHTNQVEFRVIGGKDYEYKWKEIRNLILDYMVKYKKSLLDPEFMKRKTLVNKKQMTQDPKAAYNYAKNIIKGRFPEAEPYIAQDPEYAYFYAEDILKSRFPEAEPYIAKNYKYAYHYAEDILKGRFPEAEPYIAKDVGYAFMYAKHILKGRFVEAEPYIEKDPEHAYMYAKNIIKGRFKEAEPYIAKDTERAFLYATYVINGPFPEAESYIAKDIEQSYNYAAHILKGRFPEAEPYIMKNNKYSYLYATGVIGGRFKEAEPYIMKDPESAYYYAKDIIKGRFKEAEPYIAKNNKYAYYYAKDVIKDRFPEAEPYIMQNNMYSNSYKEFISKIGEKK